MKKIIHISDLHFGTETQAMLDALTTDIHQENAHLVVISGDLTQRATDFQFTQAQAFLKSLANHNLLCVPGNHDISLHNPIERFFYPYERYQKYICPTLNPLYHEDNLVVQGINSVNPFRSMSGTISTPQLKLIHQVMKPISAATKITVMHHNLIYSKRHKIISNAEDLIKVCATAGVNIILSGHLHYACVELIKRRYLSQPLYAITAGTAVSRRIRQGQNSYNILETTPDFFHLTVRNFVNHKFNTVMQQSFPLS